MPSTAQSTTFDEGEAVVERDSSVRVCDVRASVTVFASRVDGVDPGHAKAVVFVILVCGDDPNSVPTAFR